MSNSALITPAGDFGMLKIWIDGVRHAGVKNYLVIAIDDQVLHARGVVRNAGAVVGGRVRAPTAPRVRPPLRWPRR